MFTCHSQMAAVGGTENLLTVWRYVAEYSQNADNGESCGDDAVQSAGDKPR